MTTLPSDPTATVQLLCDDSQRMFADGFDHGQKDIVEGFCPLLLGAYSSTYSRLSCFVNGVTESKR